ncbi:MAG: cell division protein SepF [Actinomycetota bacterium]|nr:cell division protein SepF [Actinomycetota bacterium]
MWKKAMTYLGLGDDEAYDEYDDEQATVEPRRQPERRPPAERAERQPSRPREPELRRPAPVDEPADVRVRGTVRPLPADPRLAESGVGAVTSRAGGSRGAVVRPLPIPVTARPHVVVPTSFNDAQEVADTFKGKAPVIMNLQEADRDLNRRLIDFASGLCYGLSGSMERVANSVYLLTPTDVEVSAEDKRRLQERGYS